MSKLGEAAETIMSLSQELAETLARESEDDEALHLLMRLQREVHNAIAHLVLPET